MRETTRAGRKIVLDKPCRAYERGVCADGRDHCYECGRHLDGDGHCAHCVAKGVPNA